MTYEEGQEYIKRVMIDPVGHGLGNCTLCGRPSIAIGIFFPTKQFAKRIGEPKGKERTVLYGLCEGHFNAPDKAEQVERQLLRDMGVQ